MYPIVTGPDCVSFVLEPSTSERDYMSTSVSLSSANVVVAPVVSSIVSDGPSPRLAYNFQWAWSTGWVAGRAAAVRTRELGAMGLL
jgi:hypothetical protein